MSKTGLTERQKKAKRLEILREQQIRKARESILSFTRLTKEDYIENWHHVEYAKKLDAFIRGEIKNLMVFMPPQHGKSELSTRRTPAMILGKDPNKKIGLICYNHTIAAKFNRDVQRIIDSDDYAEIFPDTSLNSKNARTTGTWLRNNDEFEIVEKEGSLVSVGIGGGLTSRKLDIAIMDDLYKDAADAWSHTVRQSVQDWYLTVLDTRLHNNSQKLLVFTRWHEDDLAGYLLQTEPEKWEVVIFEAIKTKEIRECDKRLEGEALWPSQHSLEKLQDIKSKNIVIFDSLYQQNPTPKEGLLLPEDSLKRFEMSMTSGSVPDAIVGICDIADEGEDSLCFLIGYQYGHDVYIVDCIFSQEPIEITQPLVASMINQYNPARARFESNNGGKGYAQKVKELIKSRTDVIWKHTATNKHTRIIMNSGNVKSNFYFRSDIEKMPMYKKFMSELVRYPINGKVKHDDAADGTTMMAEFTNNNNKWGTINIPM